MMELNLHDTVIEKPGIVRQTITRNYNFLTWIGILILTGCSWMGPDEADFFIQGDILSRSQSKTLLGQGIALNTEICPVNYAAGLYATQFVVPSILNASFYEKGSVEYCSFLLTLVPCNLDLNSDTNQDYFVGFYGSILRSCGLREKGVK